MTTADNPVSRGLSVDLHLSNLRVVADAVLGSGEPFVMTLCTLEDFLRDHVPGSPGLLEAEKRIGRTADS